MRDWVVDIVAAVAWGGGLILVLATADSLSGEIAIPAAIALCVALGFASGRYRILLVPAALILLGVLIGLIFGSGAEDCRPSEGCEDDLSPVFAYVFFAFWLGVLEAMILVGVVVRRGTQRRRRAQPG